MILINAESIDISTWKVIKFLEHPFIRINDDQILKNIIINYAKGRKNIQINGHSLKDVDSFWYRRGNLNYAFPIEKEQEYFNLLNFNLNKEWQVVSNMIQFLLEKKHSLGNFNRSMSNNKLIDLHHAQFVKLDIPPTLIATTKKDLTLFLKKHKRIITKSIGDLKFSKNNNPFKGMGTQEVTMGNINQLNSRFFPTLVQAFIPKTIEVRVFYLAGDFYPMAIFSQLDEKTAMDYRNYNNEKPNRIVPFSLPKSIEQKLHQFMEISELDTGSIDLIVTPNNQFVFLEVNPVGQFDWLSINCNYYIEKKIADYLSNEK